MSQLLDVYAALAAQVVTVDGVDVPADDLHQVRNAYERPDLPRRLRRRRGQTRAAAWWNSRPSPSARFR